MGESREQKEAFVTLATNDTYSLGCLVLGNSLRRVGTTRQLVVMITNGVSPSMKQQLDALFDAVVLVNVLDSSDTCNLNLLGRPDLSITFTKLHCWRLTQYNKCVFMDADTLVIKNIDDLFDREELSAAPDAGWPDCFNSGVFVFRPADETYAALLQFAVSHGSFDGGDQGLLNLFFNTWATADIGKHLPFTYNVVSQAFYSYLPAFKQFHDQIKIVHFIGPVKPWHHPFNMNSRTVTVLPETGHNQNFLQLWWDLFMDKVHPHLDPNLCESETVSLTVNDQPNGHLNSGHRSALPHDSGNSSNTNPIDHHSHHQHEHLTHHHNNHHHHHSQHQQHNFGHTDSRSKPTTSYSVVYPYIPPHLDDGDSNNQSETSGPSSDEQHHHHQSPSTDSHHESSQNIPEPPNVIDIPVVFRDYNTMETHYTEEPLSNVDPEYHPVMHNSETFNPDVPSSPIYTRINSIVDLVDSPTNHKGDGDGKSSEEKQASRHEIGNGKDAALEEKDEDKAGIVGDLANMKLVDSDPIKKDDRERRLQWEHGQADYMGVDRFDNIRARLDAKMTGPADKQSE